MSLWQKTYSSQLVNSSDKDSKNIHRNLEILNNTSLNLVRPETPVNSQPADKITPKEKLKTLLLCINSNVYSPSLHAKRSSQDRSADVHNEIKKPQSDPPKCSSEKTKAKRTSKVKFAIDSNHQSSEKEEKTDGIINDANDNENLESPKSLSKNSKAYRRASAPAHGMPFVYFSSSEFTSIHYFGQSEQDNHKVHDSDNQASKIPTVDTKRRESITQAQQHKYDKYDKKTLQTFNPPFQPGTFIPQPVPTPITTRSRSRSISTGKPIQAGNSLPAIVSAASYQNLPWSPAVSFLANLAQSTVSQPMPYDEGQQIGDYIIGKVIGRGGFSTVKEAIKMDNDGNMETIAVKIVRKNQESDCNDRIQALLDREIHIWRELFHPNIVPMIMCKEDDHATYVFSEYCSGGLDEDEARTIFLEIAEGLRYLHNDMKLVHKDIKLDNILLDKEGTWKICDFGLTEFQNNANGFADLCDEEAGGSIAYCAPEQARSKTSIKNPAVDIWSLGVVLYALVTNKLPFMDDFVPRLQFKIINGRYDETVLHESGCCDDLRDLLKKMFKTDFTQRLTINEVMNHRWCQQ
ncbi:18543_t:CDS:2 [Racocetra fulgida]|uniref:18543_t:CDS:1 n=1 Tax=Racocetra fulgida TaxID=60492 RepID=A0A9N9FCV7_9GLOM|nr:18543_t:CDS:2 [Racocetra fulgida]